MSPEAIRRQGIRLFCSSPGACQQKSRPNFRKALHIVDSTGRQSCDGRCPELQHGPCFTTLRFSEVGCGREAAGRACLSPAGRSRLISSTPAGLLEGSEAAEGAGPNGASCCRMYSRSGWAAMRLVWMPDAPALALAFMASLILSICLLPHVQSGLRMATSCRLTSTILQLESKSLEGMNELAKLRAFQRNMLDCIVAF